MKLLLCENVSAIFFDKKISILAPIAKIFGSYLV